MLNKNLKMVVVAVVLSAFTVTVFAAIGFRPLQLTRKSVDIKFADYTINATPNPFEEETTIQVNSLGTSFGTITIYDESSNVRRNLYEGMFLPGTNTFIWNGTDDNEVRLEAGKYILELIIGENYTSRTIILILK